MMAVLLISVGVLAVIGTLDASATSILAAQRHEQGVAFGQREIERLRAYSYAELDLSSRPTQSSDGNTPGGTYPNHPRNPNFYVVGSGPGTVGQRFLVKRNYRDKNSGTPAGVSSSGELLVDDVTNGASPPVGVAPGPETFAAGSTQITVYRYLSWRNDNRCPDAVCPGEKDSKRITIAVVLGPSGPDGIRSERPIWLSSVVTPPPTP